MGLQPFPYPRPRARFPLLPGSHAWGTNDHVGQLVAVDCLDEPCQVGARAA